VNRQPLPASAAVMIRWSDGNEYPATVVEGHADRALVAFPDGRQLWVEQAFLRPTIPPPSAQPQSPTGAATWTSCQGAIPPEVVALADVIRDGGSPQSGTVYRDSGVKRVLMLLFTLALSVSCGLVGIYVAEGAAQTIVMLVIAAVPGFIAGNILYKGVLPRRDRFFFVSPDYLIEGHGKGDLDFCRPLDVAKIHVKGTGTRAGGVWTPTTISLELTNGTRLPMPIGLSLEGNTHEHFEQMKPKLRHADLVAEIKWS
jgi:hypothetical protein